MAYFNRALLLNCKSMADLNLQVGFPQESNYPLPLTLPGGIREITLRQPNYASIPGSAMTSGSDGGGTINPTQAGLEIMIQIPQLDGCFAIPETSYLHIEAELDVTITMPPAKEQLVAVGLSASNGGILGSAASLFNRYQLWLNTATLSDDIVEFGLVSYNQFLLGFNQSNRYAMAAVLGLNKYYTQGIIGQAFNGPSFTDRAYLAVAASIGSGGNATDCNWPDIDSQFNYTVKRNTFEGSTKGTYDHQTFALPNAAGSNYFACYTGTADPATTVAKAAFTQTLRFALILPGLIGSGSNKLFPLFIGPTRISLFTDVQSNYLWFNFPASPNILGDGNVAFTPAQTPILNSGIWIKAIWINIDYLRMDGPSFAFIVENLPIPETFVIKSTGWTCSSTTMPVSQGQAETLIATRRASCKCLYLLCSPNSGAIDCPTTVAIGNNTKPHVAQWSAPGNIFGKFGSVNPNLTNGTCVSVNGILYPQQMNDPIERPDEMLSNLYRTLGVWSNDGSRPNIDPNNFFVIDKMSIALNGTGRPAEGTWRSYQTLSARICGNKTKDGKDQTDWLAEFFASKAYIAGQGDIINYTDHNPWNTFDAIEFTTNVETPFAAAIFTYKYHGPLSIYREGSMALDNYGSNGQIHDRQSLYAMQAPECNQFIYAVDFENIAKDTYLSGISTLNGSFFLRTNIKSMLTTTYTLYFILCFDILTILHYGYKTAIIKQ